MKGFIAGSLLSLVLAVVGSMVYTSALRADCREISKIKDALIVENAKKDNSNKIKDSRIEALEACLQLEKSVNASHVAKIDTQSSIIRAKDKQLINAKEAIRKLQILLKEKNIVKSKAKIKVKSIKSKPVVMRRNYKEQRSGKIAKREKSYNESIADLKKKIKLAERELKLAGDTIGKKKRELAIKKAKKEISKLKRSIKYIEIKIQRLR